MTCTWSSRAPTGTPSAGLSTPGGTSRPCQRPSRGSWIPSESFQPSTPGRCARPCAASRPRGDRQPGLERSGSPGSWSSNGTTCAGCCRSPCRPRSIPFSLYQAFTAPPVYSAMWQLPPQQRGDVHYRTLLAELHPALRDVPWSRTGTRYDGVRDTSADRLRSRQHKYGEWLRGETGSTVESLVVDSPLGRHSAYARPLRAGLRNWRRTKTSDYTRLDLLFAWLGSLGSMSNRYALDVPGASSGRVSAYPVGRAYQTAYRLAKDARPHEAAPAPARDPSDGLTAPSAQPRALWQRSSLEQRQPETGAASTDVSR